MTKPPVVMAMFTLGLLSLSSFGQDFVTENPQSLSAPATILAPS